MKENLERELIERYVETLIGSKEYATIDRTDKEIISNHPMYSSLWEIEYTDGLLRNWQGMVLAKPQAGLYRLWRRSEFVKAGHRAKLVVEAIESRQKECTAIREAAIGKLSKMSGLSPEIMKAMFGNLSKEALDKIVNNL